MTFVCNLNAIAPEHRERHQQIAHELMSQDREEMRELPDGYGFRFPADSTLCLKIAEFISNERLCCSFFNFRLELAAEGGAMWLHITGREGVKQFIQAEMG
jgi:hypothetical protein